MAYQRHDAREASPPTSDPGSMPAPRTSRPLGPRGLLATGTAALLVLAVVLPAIAAWPVASRSSYLSRGYSSGHRADDIAAPRGTRVVPVSSGRVVFAGWKSNCGGYQVWVAHSDNRYSAYYHLGKEVVYAGRTVTRESTTLGYVGTSGCVTGAHLHVEVWKGFPWRSGSYRVNPWRFLDSGVYLPARYR